MELVTALTSGAIAALAVYLGRRDLTRPAVVFAAVFFTFAAAAQLRLTTLDREWTWAFAALTIGGGLAFMVAATWAGGTRPARGTTSLDSPAYRSTRILVLAAVLICGALVGWSYKLTVLGEFPLLSGEADIVRARAVGASGEVAVPGWSSALTGGFHLAFWCLLAALWSGRRTDSRMRQAAIATLAAGALFGVALEASRNLVLLAVAVPIAGAYLLSRPAGRRRTVVRIAAVATVVLVIVGGAFVARLDQTSATNSGNAFVKDELRRHSPLLRPLLPVYINGALPFAGYRGVYDAVPERIPWGYGGYSLLSLPDAAFPQGKPDYGEAVRSNMRADRYEPFWTVATYQARPYADAGPVGVVGVSLVLGLLFGGLYRWGRVRGGLLGVVLIGYTAYYTAFMVYDNLLSFTIIGFYDIGIIAGVEWLARKDLE